MTHKATSMPKFLLAAYMALVSAVWASPAHADGYGDAAWGYSYQYTYDAIQSDMIFRTMRDNQRVFRSGNGSSSKGSSGKKASGSATRARPAPAAPRPVASYYTYTASPAVTAQVKKAMLDGITDRAVQSGRIGNREAAQTRAALDGIDMMRAVRSELGRLGYRTDSLATATTYFIMVCRSISSGRTTTTAENNAVLAQFQRGMGTTSGLARAGNADKQKYAEQLYWLATLLHMRATDVRNKSRELAEVRAQAKQAAKLIGVDFDRTTLTERGFVER
ncbi:MAG: hypothetical protein QM676_10865 [Novosphingobium sp.]